MASACCRAVSTCTRTIRPARAGLACRWRASSGGAEVRLLLGARGQDAESWSFTFTDRDGQPRLHGYHLETEGVRLTPVAETLDAFVATELERLKSDEPWSRWLHGQFFRYLITTRFAAAGLSGYAAGPLADLFVAANAVEEP